MNINFELYYIFYVVANNESISKAANELYISQPAVTQSIKKLESQLGGALFVRTKRGVILTEEGKVFYSYIKQGVEFFNNGENKFSQLKNLETGHIKIGASATITRNVLLPYIEQFHKLHPNIDIEITNHVTKELLLMLRNGTIDMLALNLPIKSNKDMAIIPCKEIQDCFVVGKDYIHLTEKPIPLDELKNYPLIFQKKPSNTREFLDNFLLQNNIDFTPKVDIASYNLVMDFTRIGFGVGYGTREFITKDLDEGTLFEIKTIPEVPKRNIGIAMMNNTIPSFGIKKLIDIMLAGIPEFSHTL
ncbi:MAG TPA: LysR family transcriptional regulator [Clostridiales bacterium]|nr:MAG: hypothetical protein A2Y22_08065 [Clostridiales bacterium GWD2_32_59]HAN09111.1 LysR family transcriptional regulator [Clostridiales bacterium]